MTAADFLLHLRNLGVKMWLDGGQLKLSAPKNVVTPELREELKARKAELIQFLEQSSASDQAGDPITPASRDGDLPVSFGQDRLWILYQLGEDSSAYNMPPKPTSIGNPSGTIFSGRVTRSEKPPALAESMRSVVRPRPAGSIRTSLRARLSAARSNGSTVAMATPSA